MVKKLVVLSTAIIAATFSSVSLANDGLGNTLNDFYGTTNLWVGGLTYSGSGGGTIPQISVESNPRIGNLYLGSSVKLAFGHINGYKSDRYTFNFKPGWIIPVASDLSIVPYLRLAAVLQDSYQGSLRDPSGSANLKFGYNIGGGASVAWSPIDRVVIEPSADFSYYRQGYDGYNANTESTSTFYLSTTEFRQQLSAFYYITKWLNVGVHVSADEFGDNISPIIYYGAGLGINF